MRSGWSGARRCRMIKVTADGTPEGELELAELFKELELAELFKELELK